MRKILVYGSLRKGEYNYESFKRRHGDGFNYLGTTKVKGFNLYSLGSYPGITESEDPEKELVVDIMECDDDCYNSIYRMEIGAGYRTQEVIVDGEPMNIYLYLGRPTRLVESGDWSQFLKSKKELTY